MSSSTTLGFRLRSIAEVNLRKVNMFEQSRHGCPPKGIRAPWMWFVLSVCRSKISGLGCSLPSTSIDL